MFKPLMFSITALSLIAAQSAFANEYTILIEEGAFYPETTYLAPGDTVKFVNTNPASVEAVAGDASWTTGPLATGGSFLLAIAPDTALQFAFASDAAKAGVLSFEFAPLSEIDGEENIAGDGFIPEATN